MPTTRKAKATQRTLNFAAAETSPEFPVAVKEEIVEGENHGRDESSRKRSAPSQTSRGGKSKRVATPKRGTAATAIVTPGDEATAQKNNKKDNGKIEDYVPIHIHKNLEYHREGEASDALPAKTLKVFRLILKHFTIPRDFEQSRFYGPLSGSTYEERVISAYRLGKLKATDEPATIICTACSELGHERDECPSLC